MKLCFISKYLPIEGGVSSSTYWLARGLGEIGNKIYVVTNAWEVEDEYREEISKKEMKLFEPKNVKVFSTSSRPPYHIPYSTSYVAKLTSLAIDIVRRFNPNLLFAFYMLPYGVSGYFTKLITKKPLVFKHAGSDITRLFNYPFFTTLFSEVFTNADKILTSPFKQKQLMNIGVSPNRMEYIHDAINLKYFDPKVKPFKFSEIEDDDPIFTYLGKTSRLKKTVNFLKAATKLKKEHFHVCMIVEKGRASEELKILTKKLGIENKVIFLPFQPPWRIPSIMVASTAIVSPESEETPYLPAGTHYPKIIREAMACGKCTIIGEGVSKKGVYSQLRDGLHTFIVDPNNLNHFAQKMKMIIKDPDKAYEMGKEARRISEKNENWREYLKMNAKIFQDIIDNQG